jgi:hypothetical protein
MAQTDACSNPHCSSDVFDGASLHHLIRCVARMKWWPSARHWVSTGEARRCKKTALQRVGVALCLGVTLEENEDTRLAFLTRAEECVSELCKDVAGAQVRRVCRVCLSRCFFSCCIVSVLSAVVSPAQVAHVRRGTEAAAARLCELRGVEVGARALRRDAGYACVAVADERLRCDGFGDVM